MCISTSLFSDTIAGGNPWPPSKLSLALELSTIPHPTRGSEGEKTFQSPLPCLALPIIPISAFLKQPDKQKISSLQDSEPETARSGFVATPGAPTSAETGQTTLQT